MLEAALPARVRAALVVAAGHEVRERETAGGESAEGERDYGRERERLAFYFNRTLIFFLFLCRA